MKEKKKTFLCTGKQEYVMCAFVLNCGNAIVTQKLKGSNGDRGEMVLKATVSTSEITEQKSHTNTFLPAN